MSDGTISPIKTDFLDRHYPIGATLECDKCGSMIHATKEQVSDYWRHGWPECHGRTMTLKTKPEKS